MNSEKDLRTIAWIRKDLRLALPLLSGVANQVEGVN